MSFWVGFLAASLFWWVIRQIGPVLKGTKEAVSSSLENVKSGVSSGIDFRYRQDVVRMLQSNHIASPMFSLSEIAVEPQLMVPPAQIIPDGDIPFEDITTLTIPYLPDLPELSMNYGGETMSLADTMSGGSSLVVIGKPGSGKTFALSHIAIQVARRDPSVQALGDILPFMVHAADLGLPANPDKLLNEIYNALESKVSTVVETGLQSFLLSVFGSKKGLLIVDGLDELPPAGQEPVLEYLQQVDKKYPGNRFLLSSSIYDLSCMNYLEITPVPMAAWNMPQTKEFQSRWTTLWNDHVLKESWAKSLPDKVDAMLLNNWMFNGTESHNPLSLTLKIWSLFAGDSLGPSKEDAIEAYIRRMSKGISNSRQALEQLAVQMTLTQDPIIARKAAGNSVASFESNEVEEKDEIEEEENISTSEELDLGLDDLGLDDLDDLIEEVPEGSPQDNGSLDLLDDDFDSLLDDLDVVDDPEVEEPEKSKEKEKKKKKPKKEKTVRARKVRRLLPELVKSHLLKYRANEKISFSHSVIGGYLAGSGLALRGDPQQLISQPYWDGKSVAWNFAAAKGDVSSLIPTLTNGDNQDPLKRGVLSVAGWAEYAPRKAAWRGNLMRTLAGLLNDESLTMGIRARILSNLAFSGEPGIGQLFRQMLESTSQTVRVLGALGSGLVKDPKAVIYLSTLLYEQSMLVHRAAALALVAINTNQAIELVTTALLEGDEDTRRSAAEALSFHPGEGHEILKEGATVEAISVRRAVVFGLSRVKEDWAVEILEKLQIDDEEWVVRNAASQSLEDMKNVVKKVPKPQPPIEDTPWLVSFAGEKGVGISPGQSSWDMLATALREGNEDQKLAALDLFRQNPREADTIIAELYQFIQSPDSDLREEAFNTLWHLGAAGVDLQLN